MTARGVPPAPLPLGPASMVRLWGPPLMSASKKNPKIFFKKFWKKNFQNVSGGEGAGPGPPHLAPPPSPPWSQPPSPTPAPHWSWQPDLSARPETGPGTPLPTRPVRQTWNRTRYPPPHQTCPPDLKPDQVPPSPPDLTTKPGNWSWHRTRPPPQFGQTNWKHYLPVILRMRAVKNGRSARIRFLTKCTSAFRENSFLCTFLFTCLFYQNVNSLNLINKFILKGEGVCVP